MLTVPVPSRNANGRPAPSRNEGPVGSLRLPQRARRPRPLQVKDEGAPLALPSHWDVESPRGRFQEVIARNIHKVQTSKVVPAVNSRETVDSSGPSAINRSVFPPRIHLKEAGLRNAVAFRVPALEPGLRGRRRAQLLQSEVWKRLDGVCLLTN